MTRLLLLTPFLAACAHTPLPCEWPRTCEERGDVVQADARPVKAERPADPKPEKDHSRDDNGDSSDDNGASSDENGGKS